MVADDRLEDLMDKDQLSLIRRQGRAFTQLEERLPAFPPTFKFEPGTSDYDMKRRPAWCDRVLYKTPQHAFKNMELVTEQTSYRSHPQFTMSDHKPVTSEFTIQVSCSAVNSLAVLFCLFIIRLLILTFHFRFTRIRWRKRSNSHHCIHGMLAKRMWSNTYYQWDSKRPRAIGWAYSR